MSQLVYSKKHNRAFYQFAIFTLMSFVNIVTLGEVVNVLLTIPQVCVVLYVLFVKRDTKTALLYHVIFILASVSALNAVGMGDEDNRFLVIYSYARLKLIGPVGVSYVIWIFIFINSLHSWERMPRNSMLYSLYKVTLYLFIGGNLLGFFGFVARSGYNLESYLSYNVYIVITLVAELCFLLNYSDDYINRCCSLVPYLLYGSIISSLISFFFVGVATSYGAYEDIILQPDIMYFAPVLLLYYFHSKEKVVPLFFFLVYVAINLSSTSGKGLIFIALAVFVFVVLGMFGVHFNYGTAKQKRITKAVIIASAAIIVLFIVPSLTTEGNLFGQKLQDVFSLFSGDLSKVDRSPYIRIATILNIVDNNLSNPLFLLFGQGYGGFFTDSLSLFYSGIDLEKGAWPPEMVASGRFSTAHDTFAVVPLLNGIWGFYLIFKISWRYIKNVRYNYLAFASLIWLLFTFYYNTQYAVIGTFFLFCSEKNLLNDK